MERGHTARYPYQTDIVIKKVEKSCMRTFSHMVQSYLDNPGISVMMKLKAKNRNEEQQFYSEYQKIMCPSCGAEISLNSNEVHCPYCGGYIKSDFFDCQIEEFLIYQDLNPNDYNYKMVAATLLVFFLPAVPCFRFIPNALRSYWRSFCTYSYISCYSRSSATKKQE